MAVSRSLATLHPANHALRAKLFRGLGDPSRLGILAALRDGPLTVGEIVDATGLSQPNASNHLACLLDCGLVRRERHGRFASYSIADDRVATILDLADNVLATSASGVLTCPRYAEPGRTT